MDANENIPPEWVPWYGFIKKSYPWWESGNYSQSMHELLIGFIMAVQIYNHTAFEYILSPLFLSYFGFGICELFLACRSTNDRNWIWGLCMVSGRISHAIGGYTILTFIYGWNHEPLVRYIGILFFLYFPVVVLLSLCGVCRRPMKTDNNVADSKTGLDDTEVLLDDNHAENISEIHW
ncbi:unnamed protein product [Microthlaspi erraticum]|uniref:Uncharacterized protein n=1 Tax=Microthlaspi erraticum TaxID=1685480 RepID=A0A6D2HND0_9BRAS|nr:unnamed protein product [Microthlaspi erraticum]